VALGIMFVARIAMFGAIFTGGGGGRDGQSNIFGLLAMAILAPIAAMFVQMALSRSREYQADASGAHLVHDGESLARALEKIEADERQPGRSHRLHHQPAHGAPSQLRRPVLDPPANHRAGCPAPQPFLVTDAVQSRRLSNCSGIPKS
jgi:heat shock protein HtpX